MKHKGILSAFCGVIFAVMVFLFYKALAWFGNALSVSLFSGALFGLLLYFCLRFVEKRGERQYRQLEQEILSPIFHQTNGNFHLGDKVRNGNIYFCDAGILFALLDARPPVLDTLPARNIDSFQFEGVHMVVHTVDGNQYVITAVDVPAIRNALREKGWII